MGIKRVGERLIFYNYKGVEMIFCGIDPGQKGAIAIINNGVVSLYVMPVVDKEIDVARIVAILNSFDGDKIVAIEKVHSMPKNGCKSSFTFGKGFGKILGMLETMMIPHVLVTPQKWKKVVLEGLNWKKRKEASIEYCKARYPHTSLLATKCSRKDHDGLADALCIAKYAWMTEGGLD